MTQETLSCARFIEGKITGSPEDYKIVAHTSNLSDSARLKSIASSYRLLDEYRKKGETAIGVFIDERREYFVLMQESLAVEDNGNLALDGYSAKFIQSHYIFLPIDLVIKGQCSTFQLLHWLNKQPIPYALKSEDDNLSSLDILLSQLSEELDRQDEDKVRASLSATDNQGQPLILSALSALLDGKQILFTPDKDNYANFLKSILLLLPAAFRSELAIAMGIIDEERCSKWAKLIIKLNGSPKSKLPENLIWLNRSANQINVHENKLIRIIKKIIEDVPNKLSDLLKKLNEITDNVGRLEEPAYLEIVTRLIGILPDELQDEEWNKCLTQVSVNQWNAIIPYLKDEQKGLLVAWQKLGDSIIQNQQDSYDLMVNIFKHLSLPNQLWVLQDNLINHLPLAEVLLNHNFLRDTSLLENTELNQLSRLLFIAVVKHKSVQDGWKEAWKFINSFILKEGKAYFRSEEDQYLTLDTILAGKVEPKDKDDFLQFFNTELVPLLPYIKVIKDTNLFERLEDLIPGSAELLNSIYEEKNLELKKLSEFAKLAEMENQQEDTLYIVFLKNFPSFRDPRPLLVNILKEKLLPDSTFKCSFLAKTYQWFQEKELKLVDIFRQLEKNNKSDFTHWNNLANILFDEPVDRAKFLDNKVGKLLPIEVLIIWLQLIASNATLHNVFLETSVWKTFLSNLSHSQFDHRLGDFAPLLAMCLNESGNSGLINRDLLHYLCEKWLNDKQIEQELRVLVTSPSVTNAFSIDDWLKLNNVVWKLGNQISLPLPRPLLTDQHKKLLHELAIDAVKHYVKPEQTQFLLEECSAWGLDLSEKTEILKAASSQALSIKLLKNYVFPKDKLFDIEKNRELLEIFLMVKPLDEEEQKIYHKFIEDYFYVQMPIIIKFLNSAENLPNKQTCREILKKVFKIQ